MLRPVPSSLLVIYLLGLGCGSLWLADRAWNSVASYRPPAPIEADLRPGEALTARLVMVVLDGVRLDASADMPQLQALARRGASGSATTIMPSLSNPARATLATGARPEVHGVTNNGKFLPPAVQSIFSSARRAGAPAAVLGSRFWRQAFGAWLDPASGEFEKELHIVDRAGELVEWQRDICSDMVRWVRGRQDGLSVVGITAPDAAAHDFGGASDAYREVVAEADRCLGAVVEAAGSATAYVVVADHGHVNRRGQGGHGGAEPQVMHVPLVLAGPGVRRAAGLKAELIDIAPTVCALLGLPFPANSEGRVLVEALDMTSPAAGDLRVRKREQQARLKASTPNRSELAAAQRAARTPPAAVAALLLLLCALAAIGSEPKPLLIALAIFLGVYLILFQAFGLAYSLSAVGREEYLNSFFLKNLIAAALAYFAGSLALRGESNLRRRRLTFAVLATSLPALRVAWVHWQTGLIMQRLMPDLSAAFTAYLDLLAIFGTSLASLLLFFWRLSARDRA